MKIMRRLPSLLYSFSVILIAYWFVIYLFPMLDLDLTREMVFFLVLAVLAECFAVSFPQGQLSAVFAVIFASYLLFGPAGAIWIIAIGCLLGQAIINRGNSLQTMLFNASQYVLAIAGGDFVFLYLGGDVSQRLSWENALPLFGFVATCFIINQLLVYLYLLPERKNYPLVYWRDALRWDGFTYLLIAPLGVLMTVLYIHVGLWGVVMLFVPVLAMQAVLRLYVNLELSNRQLRALYEVSRNLGGDLENLLDVVLKEAGRIVKYHTGIIYLWSGEKNRYEVAAIKGKYENQLKRSVVNKGEEFLGCLAESGESAMVCDSKRDPRVNSQPGVTQVHRSLLVIPLKYGGQVYGLLLLGDKRVFAFQEEHRAIFEAIACQVAVAACNATMNTQMSVEQNFDRATGLYNREYFYDYAREILTGKTVSCILADVDYLKEINYHYGYDAGDAVISYVARTISAGAGKNEIAARLTGEEFALLLPGTGEAAASKLAEKIRQGVQNGIVEVKGQRCNVRVSLGVAYHSGGEVLPDELLYNCSQALQRAKENGGNRVVVYSQMDREAPVSSLRRKRDRKAR